ncbi:MAG: hypothetical protein U0167_13170 [bacterium]
MTRFDRPPNAVSWRASYQPVSHSAAASSWSLPNRFASVWITAMDTP